MEIFEEIKANNFLNLMKNINLYIQEFKWTPSSLNTKRSTPSHSIVKLLEVKDKKKILKVAREKWLMRHKSTT